jgi:hypothetical protein
VEICKNSQRNVVEICQNKNVMKRTSILEVSALLLASPSKSSPLDPFPTSILKECVTILAL